jgi:tetratricopeptide (TPR) repeat protein
MAPKHPLGYMKLGGLYATLGKWDRAAEEFRQAVDLAPENLPVYLLLGRAYVEGKQNAKAAKVYEEAVARRPDFEAARMELVALRSGQAGSSR